MKSKISILLIALAANASIAHAGDSPSAKSFASATWTDTAAQGFVEGTFKNDKKTSASLLKKADDEALAQAVFLFDYRNGIGANSSADEEALALAVFTFDYRSQTQNPCESLN